MSIRSRLRGLFHMTQPSRDPVVARQILTAKSEIENSSRILGEIRAIQGQLERSKPMPRRSGDAPWDSKPSSSS